MWFCKAYVAIPLTLHRLYIYNVRTKMFSGVLFSDYFTIEFCSVEDPRLLDGGDLAKLQSMRRDYYGTASDASKDRGRLCASGFFN